MVMAHARLLQSARGALTIVHGSLWRLRLAKVVAHARLLRSARGPHALGGSRDIVLSMLLVLLGSTRSRFAMGFGILDHRHGICIAFASGTPIACTWPYCGGWRCHRIGGRFRKPLVTLTVAHGWVKLGRPPMHVFTLVALARPFV